MRQLFVFWFLGCLLGRPTFRELVPNGFRVLCPEDQEDHCVNNICEGIGHQNCLGGGDRNPFGMDFQASGFFWSKELCEGDSDGDGIPNGVELGDPCCLWKQGQESPETEVSHPGFANSILKDPLEQPNCKNISASEEKKNSPSSISYFELEGDNLRIFEYRMDRHVIPTDSNSYYEVQFNFNFSDDETYDIIGSEPIIDNAPILHHFIGMSCVEETSVEGLAIQRKVKIMSSQCKDMFYTWLEGGRLELQPAGAGFRVGKGTDRVGFSLTVHYNNALNEKNLTDASGVRLFMTKKLREQEVGIFITGGILGVGIIPPGKKAFYSTTFCRVNVDTEIAPDGVQLHAWFPHAHSIGKYILVEKLKKIQDLDDTDKVVLKNDRYAKIGYYGEDWKFDYNAQQPRPYQDDVRLYDGDLLVTTCVYDSTSRKQSTYGGLDTEEEMCIGAQIYTPRQAMNLQFNCAAGDRYTGDFPENVKSLLEVPLKEKFDYKKAMEQGLLVCPKDALTMSGGVANLTGDGQIDLMSVFYDNESLEEYIQNIIDNPSYLVPIRCNNEIEDYIQEQIQINNLKKKKNI